MQVHFLKHILALLLFIMISGDAEALARKKKKSGAKSHRTSQSYSTSSSGGDYYNGHKVYTGPRGGRYYINSNGNKTYIK